MEDKAYAEYLRMNYIKNISKQIKFHAEVLYHFVDALEHEGVPQREIEEMTGIQIKRDHICVFDISK